jgi:DNA-binding CsgD family transcriptional regulator
MRARSHDAADLVEAFLHRLGVGIRHDDGDAGVAARTDGTEQIGVLVALSFRLARPASLEAAAKKKTIPWDGFGLTPAERRLADELCAGNSLRDSSNHLDITYDTARKQLKVIFAKTGVYRQASALALRARLLNGGADR